MPAWAASLLGSGATIPVVILTAVTTALYTPLGKSETRKDGIAKDIARMKGYVQITGIGCSPPSPPP